MGWLGKLFAAKKAVDTVKNIKESAVEMTTSLFFENDTEKSKASLDAFNLWIEAQKVLVNENSARSATRRWVAKLFCITYIIFLFAACIVWKLDPLWSDQIFKIIKQINPTILSIIFFYYGYYAVQNVAKTIKKG